MALVLELSLVQVQEPAAVVLVAETAAVAHAVDAVVATSLHSLNSV